MYIIVKYLAVYENTNTNYNLDDSAWQTYTGKETGLFQSVATLSEAEKWLAIMTEVNPSGYYGIAKIFDNQPVQAE